MKIHLIVKGPREAAYAKAHEFGLELFELEADRRHPEQCVAFIDGDKQRMTAVYYWFNDSQTAPYPPGALLHFSSM